MAAQARNACERLSEPVAAHGSPLINAHDAPQHDNSTAAELLTHISQMRMKKSGNFGDIV